LESVFESDASHVGTFNFNQGMKRQDASI